ncbi:MAG: hypothetical protein GEU91_05530 [Rhizobiales bacterium]|nr:hypothetical protein [Hyphomicrobiales bacterium]
MGLILDKAAPEGDGAPAAIDRRLLAAAIYRAFRKYRRGSFVQGGLDDATIDGSFDLLEIADAVNAEIILGSGGP